MYHISDDKRSYESSEMIYDALVTLMNEKEYSKIKINELCERAKLGRVTFYRHYDTIDDVLRKKLDDHLLDFKKYWLEYKKQNPLEIGVFKPLLQYFYVHPKIIDLLFQSRQIYILKECLYEFFCILDEDIVSKDTDYITVIRVSIFVGVLEKWAKDGMNVLPDKLVEEVKQDILAIAKMRLK